MNKIISLYNRNRKEFWIAVIVIICILLLIQVLDSFAARKIEQENNESKNEISYQNESKSIISGGSVSESNMLSYGNLIEQFITNCNNGEVDKAYNALSTQCKEELYPNVEYFKKTYLNRNFSTKKTYKFQSWNSENVDTYKIKLFEDVLSKGNVNSGEYIEDYFTIIKENGISKLNISGFIMKSDLNKAKEEQGIKILIENVKIYKEYYKYEIKIKNNTKNDILLDSGESTSTVFLTNSEDVKLNALLYENEESDFIVKTGEEKNITIKFGVTFREDLKIESVNITDIVKDYNGYLNDKESNVKRVSIKVEL